MLIIATLCSIAAVAAAPQHLSQEICVDSGKMQIGEYARADDFYYGHFSFPDLPGKPIHFYVGSFPETSSAARDVEWPAKARWGSKSTRYLHADGQVSYVVSGTGRDAQNEPTTLFVKLTLHEEDAQAEARMKTVSGLLYYCGE